MKTFTFLTVTQLTMVFVIEPRRLAALSISFFGKNHFGKRNNGIMLKLFLYLILCLWVVSVKTGNIVVLIYDKLFKRALHKFKLWMVYLWKLKPVLSPHLWRWQHAASDKVQSVRMSESHCKNAPNWYLEWISPKWRKADQFIGLRRKCLGL